MTVLEDLKLEYLSLKKDMEDYQSDEKCAHNKVIECKRKMERIEKILNRDKLKESILFIKDFCKGRECFRCKFHDENIYAITSCKLRNDLPKKWTV